MNCLGKRIAVIATLAALCASRVFAGDIAAFQPLGFSSDGSVFAFEEYGIQDGSGFPYANIYAIDTISDKYLAGTPIRVRIDDENEGLSAARAQVFSKAAPLLKNHHLADQPGQLVAFNPLSEVASDAHMLRYLAFATDPAVGKPFTLAIDEFSETAPAVCKDFVAKVTGFRLKLKERDGVPANVLLYKDDHVPSSRNCPTGYRLGGVVTYAPAKGKTIHVALVLVLSHGFEGRDGRWIAVPLRP
ncbi:MAG: DUF2259 domain-containing protein [Allorhizobium sp.]